MSLEQSIFVCIQKLPVWSLSLENLSPHPSVLQAWSMYKRGKLGELVDEALKMESSTNKACKYLKIGLLCIQDRPARRPNMSAVAKMLKGEIDVDEMKIPKPRKRMVPESNRFWRLPRVCF